MAKQAVEIHLANGDHLTGHIDESDLTTCEICGDDLYIHEWVQLDEAATPIRCDRRAV